jgi:Na+/H+ antiporter NhaC
MGISPVIIFLLLYVVVSVVIGDFYRMPFSVALLCASVWAIATYKGRLTERIEVFSRAAGHANIIYMIWIFILAGAFAAIAKEIGAVNATVDLILRLLPAGLIVPGIFVASCFISLAVGTSVGTVVALTPLATEIAGASGGSTAFMVAVVLGGAFFGDNLSFISDTTIAATRTQGCEMADKFRANVWLAVPAALVTLAFYMIETPEFAVPDSGAPAQSVWLVLPYMIVIVTAIVRMNVNIVLSLGIVASLVIGIAQGHHMLDLCGFMGSGIDGMGGLIVITLMSAGMLGVVKASGGITWLLQVLTARVKGTRGAQFCIALLVSLVNLCTANNTVAIIIVGSMSKEIARRYGVSASKTASLLDTCSCIIQCLIPYGAQTLLACSLSGLSPAEPFAYLYYPWALAVMVIASIFLKAVK